MAPVNSGVVEDGHQTHKIGLFPVEQPVGRLAYDRLIVAIGGNGGSQGNEARSSHAVRLYTLDVGHP